MPSLYTAVTVILASTSILVAAQSATLGTYNSSVPQLIASVSQTTRQAWCLSEITTCGTLCNDVVSNGQKQNDTLGNTCDPSTLEFECTCVNNFVPNLSQYAGTITYYECTELGAQCLSSCPNDLTCQNNCNSNYACDAIAVPQPSSAAGSTTGPVTVTVMGSAKATGAAATVTSISSPSSNSATDSPNTPLPTSTVTSSQPLAASKIAGIVVACLVATLFAILVTWYIVRRRLRRQSSLEPTKQDPNTPGLNPQTHVFEKQELEAGNEIKEIGDGSLQHNELEGHANERRELHGGYAPAEMPSRQSQIYEVP
ncbi:hypothetical protein MMC19_005366 [Ptychographa xylographoides]|nr:hypothetical protein [Ptychographa xylographoides]